MLTVPNGLTGARLLLSWLIPAMLMQGYERLYVLVLALGLAATDLLDGLIARLLKQESGFGKILDPIADCAYCVSLFAAVLIIYQGRTFLVFWYVLAGGFVFYGWTVTRWRCLRRIERPNYAAKLAMGLLVVSMLIVIGVPFMTEPAFVLIGYRNIPDFAAMTAAAAAGLFASQSLELYAGADAQRVAEKSP